MTTFLFASIPVTAHTSNPMPIAARLVERGHTVLWYAGAAYRDKIESTGARFHSYVDAPDFSGHDIFEYFPEFAGKSGPRMIGMAFERIFVGHAPQRVADLRRIVLAQKAAETPVDAMLTDGLSYGVGLVGELEHIPWATFGDGPLPYAEADTPPFGPGMLPMRGPLGRLRNAAVHRIAAAVIFRGAEERYRRIRAELGLPPGPAALDLVASPHLHLQGCTPGFEYPYRTLPAHIHWIGALRPDPVRDWTPPSWWSQRDDRPLVHVTQGSLRPDLDELIVPALRALADERVRVVVTTGGSSADDVAAAYGEPLPANCVVERWLPYDELLARADVFVTNGGYTGVTLALAHGVPIVQAGTTEEKAEIAARIQYTGVGIRLGKTHPDPSRVRAAVRRVLSEPRFADAARRVQAQMAQHDAANEAADLLERLAARRDQSPVVERG